MPQTAEQTIPDLSIDPDRIYPIEEFKARLKVSAWAWRQIRAKGLNTIKVGLRRFVRGRDWYALLDKLDAEQNGEREV